MNNILIYFYVHYRKVFVEFVATKIWPKNIDFYTVTAIIFFFFGKMIFIVCEQKIDKKIQTNAIYNIHNYIQNTKI